MTTETKYTLGTRYRYTLTKKVYKLRYFTPQPTGLPATERMLCLLATGEPPLIVPLPLADELLKEYHAPTAVLPDAPGIEDDAEEL